MTHKAKILFKICETCINNFQDTFFSTGERLSVQSERGESYLHYYNTNVTRKACNTQKH